MFNFIKMSKIIDIIVFYQLFGIFLFKKKNFFIFENQNILVLIVVIIQFIFFTNF
mgnify:CR=1 FL=1